MRAFEAKTAIATFAAGVIFVLPLNATADAFSRTFIHSNQLTTAQLPSVGDLLRTFAPVADQELNDSRGGFDIAGVSFNFGASVQTLVNGQLALQTNVQWTAAGAVVTQLQGLAANGSASPTAAASNVSPAAAQTSSVPTSSTLSGVQIQSPTGTTDVLNNVANGQIQNVILNSASGQNIVQNTNVVLTIYNFSTWQQELAQHAVSTQIANQMLSVPTFALGR